MRWERSSGLQVPQGAGAQMATLGRRADSIHSIHRSLCTPVAVWLKTCVRPEQLGWSLPDGARGGARMGLIDGERADLYTSPSSGMTDRRWACVLEPTAGLRRFRGGCRCARCLRC